MEQELIAAEQAKFAFYASCLSLRLYAEMVPDKEKWLSTISTDWKRLRNKELQQIAEFFHTHQTDMKFDVEEAHVETVQAVNYVTDQINQIFSLNVQ